MGCLFYDFIFNTYANYLYDDIKNYRFTKDFSMKINLIIQFMNGNDNVTEYEGLNKGDKSILEYSLIMLRCTK